MGKLIQDYLAYSKVSLKISVNMLLVFVCNRLNFWVSILSGSFQQNLSNETAKEQKIPGGESCWNATEHGKYGPVCHFT